MADSSRPGQRLILLYDGTWDDFDDRTNVYRMASAIVPYDGPTRQRFFYQSGVGTSRGTQLLGGVTGAGLTEILLEGYEWLAKRYEPGDEIWVFGFSRGAYTARSLAGLIRKCGLLRIVTPKAIHEATRLYRDTDVHPESSNCRQFRSHYSVPGVDIHFLGVWDTVGALGIPGHALLSRQFFEWHDTELSGIVRHAYQAMALDEHREEFDVSLWRGAEKSPGQKKPEQFDVEQRWFVGSHGDVGGGCIHDELSQIPLRWMQEKAMAAGLKLDPVCQPPEGAELADYFDSYQQFLGGAYSFMRAGLTGKTERFHRLFDRVRKSDSSDELVPAINVTIDPSVFRRMQALSYAPPTLEGRTGMA